MSPTRKWSLTVIALEFVLAGVMASVYVAWFQPSAPRNHKKAVVVPGAVVPAVQPLPAPEPVAPVVPASTTPVKLAVAAPAKVTPPAPRTVPALVTPEEHIERGMTSLNGARWAAAIEAFEAARTLQPRHPDLGYLTGIALENLDQPGAAIDAFEHRSVGAVFKAYLRLDATFWRKLVPNNTFR